MNTQAVHEIRAAGRQALLVTTELLHRVRLADPLAGCWEAADVQWWWRMPRPSDQVEKVFWIDEQGPVAAALLTSTGERDWQCDPLLVPGADGPALEVVWGRAEELIAAHVVGSLEVQVYGEDAPLRKLLDEAGLVPGEVYASAWMDAVDRPPVLKPPDGFVIVDRTERPGTPHPMRKRSGEGVEERLVQCPLYSPDLDLAVETDDGRQAGYVLFWFDPTTLVGLVEPVRVEEDFQRRGLARSMLTVGIDRLAARGARRIKISWLSEGAGALYQSIGFQRTSSDPIYSISA